MADERRLEAALGSVQGDRGVNIPGAKRFVPFVIDALRHPNGLLINEVFVVLFGHECTSMISWSTGGSLSSIGCLLFHRRLKRPVCEGRLPYPIRAVSQHRRGKCRSQLQPSFVPRIPGGARARYRLARPLFLIREPVYRDPAG